MWVGEQLGVWLGVEAAGRQSRGRLGASFVGSEVVLVVFMYVNFGMEAEASCVPVRPVLASPGSGSFRSRGGRGPRRFGVK